MKLNLSCTHPGLWFYPMVFIKVLVYSAPNNVSVEKNVLKYQYFNTVP